jgi:hypothetical protein
MQYNRVAGNPSKYLCRPEVLSSARPFWVGWRAAVSSRRFCVAFSANSAKVGFGWRGGLLRTEILPEKSRFMRSLHSSLLARSAAGFGLYASPVTLLREAFARLPPWSSPWKPAGLGSVIDGA